MHCDAGAQRERAIITAASIIHRPQLQPIRPYITKKQTSQGLRSRKHLRSFVALSQDAEKPTCSITQAIPVVQPTCPGPRQPRSLTAPIDPPRFVRRCHSPPGSQPWRMGFFSWFGSKKVPEADQPQAGGGCPVMHSKKPATGAEGASQCPVPHDQRHPMILLDPRNNMQAGGESQ